ncbi:MAG TPA: tetratricopeptide repeat protein, partial [Pyrinomonadaceae bacterium]
MGNESLLKNPKTALLASGSVLFASAFLDVCAGGAAFTLPLLASAGFGILKDVAPEFFGASFQETFLKSVSRKEILQNGDLRRAVGKAIFVLILDESRNEQYGTFREIIRDVGKSSLNLWETYIDRKFKQENAAGNSTAQALERILPNRLTPYFARRETDLDSVTSLSAEAWATIVKELFQTKTYYPKQETALKIGERLHHDFPKALRKVLVDDFSRDGKAYASMQLRISGEMLAYIQEIKKGNDEIKAEVEALRQDLNQKLPQFPPVQTTGEVFWQEVSDAQTNLIEIQTESLEVQKNQLIVQTESVEIQTESLDEHKKQTEILKQIAESGALTRKQQEEIFKGLHKSFPRVPNFFTGRKKVLEDLEKTLATENQASFYGTHGLGKTRTAIEYALRNREKYSFILFISAAKGNFTGNAAFAGAEISEEIEKATSLEAKFNLFIEYLQNNPNWLIIVDNVEDVPEVVGKIPRHFDGKVIYTSNLPEIENAAPLVTIEAMTPEEAELTLSRRKLADNKAKIEDIPAAEREAITKIVEKIGTLPIALNLAGAFIRRYKINFREYLKDYNEFEDTTFQNFDLADYYGENFIKGLNKDEQAEYKGIAGVFLLSYQRIIQPKDDTEREKLISQTLEAILNISVFLAPEKVPEEIWLKGLKLHDENLAKAAKNPLFWLEVRNRLTQAAFFVKNGDDNTSTTHRLIQAILQKRLQGDEKRHFAKIAVDSINYSFPEPIFENWKECNRLQKHAETALNYAENLEIETENSAALYNQIAYYIDDLAEYEKAVIFYQKALKIDEKTIGKVHPDYATSLNNLALVYKSQGRYDEAIELYQQAIEIDEKTIGKVHPAYAIRLNNLAGVYELQGRYDEAIKLYQQAIEIDEKTIGKVHPGYAIDLNNLAGVYKSQGRYDEAIELYQQAIEIDEKTIGKVHPDYAIRLNNLAEVYRLQGKYDVAIELYQQAIEIAEKTIGKVHPAYAIDLNNLALVYQSQGKYDEAVELYQQALEITGKAVGKVHPAYAIRLNNLAGVYQLQGRYDEAIELYQQAIEIDEKTIGKVHPAYATRLNNLAGVYKSQGRYDEAIELYQQAIEIDEKTIGKVHPAYAIRLNNLAGVYELQGRYD